MELLQRPAILGIDFKQDRGDGGEFQALLHDPRRHEEGGSWLSISLSKGISSDEDRVIFWTALVVRFSPQRVSEATFPNLTSRHPQTNTPFLFDDRMLAKGRLNSC